MCITLVVEGRVEGVGATIAGLRHPGARGVRIVGRDRRRRDVGTVVAVEVVGEGGTAATIRGVGHRGGGERFSY